MTTKDHVRAASILARVMDDQFKLLGVRVGVDPLLDFVPGLGSLVGAVLSFYIVWIAWTVEIPNDQIARMIKNIAIDFFIGEIPVVGLIGDILYKSNRMNLEILKKYLPNNIIEGEIVK